MKVGIPREVKNHEYRVAITPAGVHELVRNGHDVFVEAGAGLGSSITDEEFAAAGAKILADADEVWGTADLVLKVKEPIAEEYHRMREGQILFTYLHLAASPRVHRRAARPQGHRHRVRDRRAARPSLPLLAPMSEVAGRLAPQVGAYHLMRAGRRPRRADGRRPGVYAAKVVVIGAGVSGHERGRDRARHAGRGDCCWTRTSTSCASRTRSTRATCRPSRPTRTRSRRRSLDADLVIGAVLVPGAKAPTLISNELVSPDEAGQRARRHLDRPGRLLRGLAPDHARRPGLHGAQLRLLLRREHARRGAAHLARTR